MNTDLQTYLVQEFKRRGIPVVTENQFKDYCLHKNLAYALHWSVVDPSLSVQRNWELFGYTGSTLELYWHLTTCNALEEVLLYSDDPAGTIYHTTAGRTYQVRAPTDFLASLFGLFALVHPAGKALVSIGVTGGISAVSGSLNTILNSSYAAHDLVQSTEHIAAWQVANAYCSGKSAPQCKFTRAPHH